MKQRLITVCLFTAVLATSAFADDAGVLQSRLNQVNSFHASFTQRVSGVEGDAVQESEGELWVKRPNLFNWHMIAPDENVLVSDGKTLWFYNSFVEQATANWLNNVTENTPFMLITRNSAADWGRYNVKQHGDSFTLLPKEDNDNLKQIMINVAGNGIITGFTAVEQDGKRSTYYLKNQKNGQVDSAKFYFILPKGVTLDDQRQ
ncbi:outer membrane lipoprotein chaperone LolA [Candidatus Doolittlea endobia]|uniref:Outer-membrane lipoprotein carrier protein n=1 Tax=Candidatus Doolittlea endobia TaxID=1778262 RepID=A0A143WSM8_9ENTR|nr:outer membrane lipoprotein chaperone LolA [Candidatus Doolittlea endobia]CUX96728.1 Outer-membrane lipoprotein carrier protein precursor [Candidatus Doolittlea endobia]